MTEFNLVSEIRGAMLFGRDAKARLTGLKAQQPLIMECEPTNPVDPKAIILKDLFLRPIGYMAREQAAIVAPLLGQETGLLCKVLGEQPRILVYRPPPEPRRVLTTQELSRNKRARTPTQIAARKVVAAIARLGGTVTTPDAILRSLLRDMGGVPRVGTPDRVMIIYVAYALLKDSLSAQFSRGERSYKVALSAPPQKTPKPAEVMQPSDFVLTFDQTRGLASTAITCEGNVVDERRN